MDVGTKFGLSDAAYRAFRPGYPEPLYARLLGLLDGPRACAVDLGAGTGLVSARMAPEFDELIAVEPDERMAAHIAKTAPNARTLVTRAEDASLAEASVDLVTCVNAFHWMEGELVCQRVASWLRAGGLFAGWRYPFPSMPAELSELIDTHMRERWAPFRAPAVLDIDALGRHLRGHPSFELLVDEFVPNPVEMQRHELLGFVRSTSFCSAYLRTLDEDQARDYLDTLDRDLGESMATPTVIIDMQLAVAIARRRSL